MENSFPQRVSCRVASPTKWCAEVTDNKPFAWTDTGFRPKKTPFIYECHIGMASEEGKVASYKEFKENVLPRVQKLGYNTLQIMAIMEQLLDFGFASYRMVTPQIDLPHSLPVTCGVTEQVKLSAAPPALLLEKGASGALTQTLSLPDFVEAPVKKGQQLGTVEFAQNGVSLGVIPVLAAEDAKRMDFLTMLNRILTNIFSFL